MSRGDVYILATPADRKYHDRLVKQLTAHCADRIFQLAPGDDKAGAATAVDEAQVIVVLLSPDLLAGPGTSALLDRALKRHDSTRGLLIPVQVRATLVIDGQGVGRLQIIDAHQAPDDDATWVRVAREVLHRLPEQPGGRPGTAPALSARDAPPIEAGPPEVVDLTLHLSGPPGPRPGVPTDGDGLFRLLFPRGLQPPRGEHPALRPHRVTIHTADPVLGALRYFNASCDGILLRENGWRFAVRSSARLSQTPAELRPPVCVLALLPDDDAPLLRERLHDDVHPDQGGDDHLQHAATWDRLLFLLDGHPADVLLLFPPAPPTPAQLARLRAACERRSPSLICTTADPDARLALSVPARVHLDLPGAPDAPLLIREFLAQVLGQGRDPLEAAAALPDTLVPSVSSGTLIPRVFTGGAPLIVYPAPRRTLDPYSHLRLDRDLQRAVIARHVRRLLDPSGRRVEAVIAYGGPGNLVNEFARQAVDELEVECAIRHLRPPFPRRSEHFSVTQLLPNELRTFLRGEARDPLGLLLRRHAWGSDKAVLFLDYGTLGKDPKDPKDHQRAIHPGEIEEWLGFCQRELTSASDLRVVAYMGLVVDAARHDGLKARLEQCGHGLLSTEFGFTLLLPLTQVGYGDLMKFLTDRKSCRRPPDNPHEVADAIFKKTGGVYKDTVNLLDAGERHGWLHLLRRLRGGEAPPVAPREREDDL